MNDPLCKVCGKPFFRADNRTLCCSPECKAERKRRYNNSRFHSLEFTLSRSFTLLHDPSGDYVVGSRMLAVPQTVREGNFDYGTRFEHGDKVFEVRGKKLVEIERSL